MVRTGGAETPRVKENPAEVTMRTVERRTKNAGSSLAYWAFVSLKRQGTIKLKLQCKSLQESIPFYTGNCGRLAEVCRKGRASGGHLVKNGGKAIMLAFRHYLPKCELEVHLTEVEYPP